MFLKLRHSAATRSGAPAEQSAESISGNWMECAVTVKGWISGVAVFATGSDPILKVGAVQSEVTVASTATLVNTTNQTLSGLVDDRRMQDLPLNGRNIL